MKVEVDGRELHLHFKHSDPDKEGRRTTSCSITAKDGSLLARAVTKCHPGMDQFEKKEGRKWALKYALKDGNFSREERTQIWEGYNNRFLQGFQEAISLTNKTDEVKLDESPSEPPGI